MQFDNLYNIWEGNKRCQQIIALGISDFTPINFNVSMYINRTCIKSRSLMEIKEAAISGWGVSYYIQNKSKHNKSTPPSMFCY